MFEKLCVRLKLGGYLYDLPERSITLLFLDVTNLLEGFVEACQSTDWTSQGLLDTK